MIGAPACCLFFSSGHLSNFVRLEGRLSVPISRPQSPVSRLASQFVPFAHRIAQRQRPDCHLHQAYPLVLLRIKDFRLLPAQNRLAAQLASAPFGLLLQILLRCCHFVAARPLHSRSISQLSVHLPRPSTVSEPESRTCHAIGTNNLSSTIRSTFFGSIKRQLTTAQVAAINYEPCNLDSLGPR